MSILNVAPCSLGFDLLRPASFSTFCAGTSTGPDTKRLWKDFSTGRWSGDDGRGQSSAISLHAVPGPQRLEEQCREALSRASKVILHTFGIQAVDIGYSPHPVTVVCRIFFQGIIRLQLQY